MASTTNPASVAATGAPNPGDTLNTVLDAARIAAPIHQTADGRLFAIIPSGHMAQDISDCYRLPPRVIQSVTVDDRRSLSAYANQFSQPTSIIIANYDAMTISVRLDWHPGNQAETFGDAAAAQHTVALKLRASEEWKRWDGAEGNLLSQAEFAAFLEENSVDITSPEAATMIEISRDLEATQALTFKASNRLENGDRSFRFETETRVENKVVVPREFTLNMPLYNGEDPVELRAAFRYRPTPEGLKLGFEWRRVEYQRQAYFTEIAATVAEETGLPFFLGRAT